MSETTPWFKRIDWVTSSFLILTPILAFTLTPIYTLLHQTTWQLIAMFVIFAAITNLSITAGYHRYLAHQSYQASKWVRIAYLFFGAAAFQGSALKWCSDHRRHHRHVDTDQDPYNINRGFFYAHMGWLFIKNDPRFDGQFAPDLMKDPYIRFQHRYYGWIATITGFGLPWAVGYAMGTPFGGLIFGGFLRVVVTHHTTFFINSLCHMVGSQTYGTKNSARDSLLMAVFTHGEGYHNFHHHFQADYRNGIRWFDWDPTKWFIQMLALIGAAYKLRVVSNYEILKARLKEQERVLITQGHCADHASALRTKIEESQKKWQQLKIEYKTMRKNMSEQSHEKMEQLRAEVRRAKLEFRGAMRLWMTNWKMFRRQAAFSRVKY